MIHLFARLPAERQIRTKVTLNCIRLCKEWQMWVSKSRSLRKVFVSIKGTYYQAEILGEKVTWYESSYECDVVGLFPTSSVSPSPRTSITELC